MFLEFSEFVLYSQSLKPRLMCFVHSHDNQTLDLKLGSRPSCEVVLNLHLPVKQGLIAFLTRLPYCQNDKYE